MGLIADLITFALVILPQLDLFWPKCAQTIRTDGLAASVVGLTATAAVQWEDPHENQATNRGNIGGQ
jgi:hypothetical protein